MMLKFEPGTQKKQALVTRLGELTGYQPIAYSAPRGAFQCGDYLVDGDGRLTVEAEQADAQVLSLLLSEGMIGQGEVLLMQEHLWKRMHRTLAACRDGLSEATVQTEATVLTDATVQTDASVERNAEVSLPLMYFSGTALRNLLYLMACKEPLLNKATDGCFHVPEGLLRAMQDDSCTYGTANFRRMLMAYEQANPAALVGLTITETHVIFTGMGKHATKEQRTAYTSLLLCMSAQAIHQRRIVRKQIDLRNEKYAMRNWMACMGMCGKKYQAVRRLLLKKMDGVTTYATAEKARAAREKLRKCPKCRKGRKKP